MTQTEITKAPTQGQTDLAFALSLIGGIVMSVGSVLGMFLVFAGRPFFWGMMGGGYGYMMGGYFGNGYYSANLYGMMMGYELVGLTAGILVMIFTVLAKSRPNDRKILGILILSFSLVGLIGMGGFFVGSILGLVGGALFLVGS